MNRWSSLLLVVLAISVSSVADGQTYNVLRSLSGTNEPDPYGSLTLSGSTLYGTTRHGGDYGGGNIFTIQTDGSGFRDVWDFDPYPHGPGCFPSAV